MPLERHALTARTLTEAERAAWRDVPAAVASDAMNRTRVMAAAIKPMRAGMRLFGQARTVQVPVGDNTAIHAAIALARPGDVLAIDAGGYVETSVWGGILNAAAMKAGIAGVVVDGVTRDSVEIAEGDLPFFCRGVSARGGQKGGSGGIDVPIAVGGVPVAPGDLVIGDDDGVTVVPLDWLEATFTRVEAGFARERTLTGALEEGRTTAEILGIAIPPVTHGA